MARNPSPFPAERLILQNINSERCVNNLGKRTAVRSTQKPLDGLAPIGLLFG